MNLLVHPRLYSIILNISSSIAKLTSVYALAKSQVLHSYHEWSSLGQQNVARRSFYADNVLVKTAVYKENY